MVPFLFDEPGVIDDQDTVGFAELGGDVFLQVVADVIGLPLRSGEEVLQAVRGLPNRTCPISRHPALHKPPQAAAAIVVPFGSRSPVARLGGIDCLTRHEVERPRKKDPCSSET
ncbi:hypothetical protein GCM10027075_21410 [Streptomyces heilongjiangensis]